MRASPALLTFYTFTSPFAGTIRATPPPTQPLGPWPVCGIESTAKQLLLGAGPRVVARKATLAIDRATRCRNQSWPWPPTPCCRADQEPNLLKEKQLPNSEKISTDTTLSVLL
jgi:hypothetical protein